MQPGQLQNLQRLERQYMQALSQNGWESPIVVSTAVDFANTLIRDGRILLKLGNQTQAEMFFNRAKEVVFEISQITTPISITSGIFYTSNFVRARGHAILQIAQLHESQNQYQKAWINIRDVLPFMEKFAYTKRVNINEEDQLVLKLYSQLLYHGVENCRMQHRKDDMLDQCNKLVDILQRLGITFESLRKLTKDEFHSEYKKWFTMLARAFYHIGKSQFKVGFEREALRNLYKSWQISELLYGSEAPNSIKARDKYEKLSQKMEFEMIMGSEKVDFQQFKAELQKDVGQDLLRKVVNLKPNKNFNHHILQQVKSYQQIVTQLTSHSSKYQMPEYVKKVRQDYEDKLRTISDQKQVSEEQQKYTKYIIKNKKSSSRAASTYMNQSMLPQDRLFSPRLSNTHSQRISIYQNLMENQMDQLKYSFFQIREYLQNTELKQQPVNDMMLMRPQFKSEHVQIQQKINIKETQKYKSNRFIQKSINRQQTNVINKSETQQSEQKIAKVQTVSELNAQQIEEVRQQTTESLVQQSPLQIVQIPLLQNVKTEITEASDNLMTDYLNRYSIEQLNIAASKIQKCFRKYREQLKSVTTPDITPLNIIKPISQTQTSEKIDSLQTGRNQMKMSVKEMKNSLRKAKNFGFDSIVKEIKQTESDQSSSNKAKTVYILFNQLISIIVEFFNLPEQDLYFLDKLLFDHEVKLWRLSNISLRAFNQQQASSQTEEEEQQLPIDNPPIEISNNINYLEHQLHHIMNMFTNIQAIKALQLIVYFTISNDKKQYTINFIIQNFVSYLDEYQRWFSKDRLENFNGLLGIYCKQQNLCQPTNCGSLIFHHAEFTTQLVSKLVYTLRNHYYLMRSVLGYKIISMREVIERELQNDIIDVRIIQKNDKIRKEAKRQMLSKYLKIEPLKIQERIQDRIPTTSLSSTRLRQKIQYTEELNLPQDDSIIIHNSEKSQFSEQRSGKTIIQSSATPTDRLQFSKNKSIDNTQEQEQMILQQIKMRSPKKQYSVINSRYTTTLASPRNIVASSQALIKSAAIRQHGSHFLDLSKREKSKLEPPTDREQKLSIDDSLRTRTKSDVELLQEYFPEFNYANLDDFANYEPQEGPLIQFSEMQIKSDYFPPQGQIIYPDPEELECEFPDSCVLLNFTLKNQRITTGFLHFEMGETYMILDDQTNQTIKRKFPLQLDQRLLEKEEKIKILAFLQNKEVPPQPLTFIEQMLSSNHRHVSILLNRYINRINHYDVSISNEAYSQLQSNQILPLTTIINLNQSEYQSQIVQEVQNKEIPFQPFISVMEGLPLISDFELGSKQFRTYQTPFNIQTNKFYIKDKNLYCKIEVSFKEVKVFDTKLLYLSDQQAKQDLILLRKQMHQLIGKQEVQVKMRQYYPNQKITFYRNVGSLEDIEKVLHIFQKPTLVCHQIKAQARIEHRLIGKALQINRKTIGLQERNRDKFSSLDQFLLLFIKDPGNLGSKSRLLKQTILFYYFKQQLKLTLISSSRLSYFMKTYFIRRSFNAQSRVSNIGKVYVECEVYQFNKFYIEQELEEHTYFYFQITPQESRTKLFKLVLDLADICSICPKVCAENCFKDRVLHDIINTLTAYLVCYKTNTYHGLKIPLSYIANQSKYDLHNTFKEVTYGNNLLEDQTRQSQPRLSMLMNDSQLRSNCQTQIMDIQIENLQLPEEANRILKNTSMLTPVFRGQKFIYKTTKIVNSMYIIITVQFLSIGIFQLGIYVPQTCRNFCCYIQQSDFRNMNPIFLESIFPSALVTKETIDQFYVNRWKFSEISRIYLMAVNHPEEFDDFFSEMRSQARAIPQLELQKLTESRLSLNNEDELIEKPYDETPKLFESFSDQSRQNLRSSTQPPIFVKKQFSKQLSVQNSLGNQVIRLSLPNTAPNKQDKSLFFKHSPRMSNGSMENFYSTDRDLFFNSLLIRKNNLDMISTFEIKIWESLINKMTITKNKQNHFIFNLDSFQGVLRESLYTQVVYLGNEVNALFEVFVENVRKPLDMFKNFLPIRLNESQNFSMYQRITLFEMPKTVNFKLMLRKVLYTVLDQYEFIQSDIQKCAVYMLNMLKKQFKLDSSKFIIQEVQTDEKCPQLIKVNANYQQYAALQNYQYTLLKRMIFTMKPSQIYVSIFYREKSKKFYLYFESMKNCKNTIIKYPLLEIQKCIPSALSLLKLNLHQELGQRIFQSFKNRLLVQTYQQLV